MGDSPRDTGSQLVFNPCIQVFELDRPRSQYPEPFPPENPIALEILCLQSVFSVNLKHNRFTYEKTAKGGQMKFPHLSLAVIPLLLITASAAPPTQPVTPESILAEINALPRPNFDKSRSNDEEYVKDHEQIMARTWQRQAELELEFYQRFPDHPQAEQLLIRRWGNMLVGTRDTSPVAAEVQRYLKDHPTGPRTDDDKQALIRLKCRLAKDNPQEILKIAEDFAKSNPHNETAADMLFSAAELSTPAEKEKLFRRIINDYPNSSSAILAGGKLRQASQIGLPFDLGFFDVTTGNWVHTRWLRGKVIIVQFWATWCGPCIGEIPQLKEFYARYKDQGLEILGVSLDGPRTETNLDTLKEFIKKNKIEWPQYYQGESFDSAFSRSWAISAIPTIFVLDREGKLRSTDAREKLDTLIPDLLAAKQSK